NLNLRWKLGLGLSMAAILPIVIGAGAAVWLTLRGLDQASRSEAMRSVRVALNLVLRQAQQLQNDAGELAADNVLSDFLVTSPLAVASYLQRTQERLGSGLVEVADTQARIVGRHSTLDPARLRDLSAGDRAPAVRAALDYDHRVTLLQTGEQLA